MSRPLRYIAEFNELDEMGNRLAVGYHCGLGNKQALAWAKDTASRYYARLLMELTDGTFELVRDHSHRRQWVPGDDDSRESATNPV